MYRTDDRLADFLELAVENVWILRLTQEDNLKELGNIFWIDPRLS
jgi:hypothetical protein